MNVKISLALENDLEEILTLQKEAYIQEAEIYKDFSIPPLKQKIESVKEEWQQGIILKAEIDRKIVGSVRAYMENETCKIGKLIVDPEHQNQGIGKSLVLEIEKYFLTCKTFELFTGYKSSKNLSLYRKTGYEDFKEEKLSENIILIYLRKTNSCII